MDFCSFNTFSTREAGFTLQLNKNYQHKQRLVQTNHFSTILKDITTAKRCTISNNNEFASQLSFSLGKKYQNPVDVTIVGVSAKLTCFLAAGEQDVSVRESLLHYWTSL